LPALAVQGAAGTLAWPAGQASERPGFAPPSAYGGAHILIFSFLSRRILGPASLAECSSELLGNLENARFDRFTEFVPRTPKGNE